MKSVRKSFIVVGLLLALNSASARSRSSTPPATFKRKYKQKSLQSWRGGNEESSSSEQPIRFSTWATEIVQPITADLTFAVAKDGDGSGEDPDGIPTRYMIAHKQNREKANAAFQKCLQWRKEHNIDTILVEPHKTFELCSEIFPIYFPGRDPQGNLIVVQRPGMVDFVKAKEKNITTDDILMHYIYMIEYAWNLLDPLPLPPKGLMTAILDCQGVKLSLFRDKEYRTFFMKCVSTMSDNYPTRSFKTLVINAPKWIQMAYNVVKPLLRESSREKIMILKTGVEQDEILKEVLGGGDNLPSYLRSEKVSSGDDEIPLSTIEKEMKLVAAVGLKNLYAETQVV